MKKRSSHSAVEIIINERERLDKRRSVALKGSTGAAKGPSRIPSLASMRAYRNAEVKAGRLVVAESK